MMCPQGPLILIRLSEIVPPRTNLQFYEASYNHRLSFWIEALQNSFSSTACLMGADQTQIFVRLFEKACISMCLAGEPLDEQHHPQLAQFSQIFQAQVSRDDLKKELLSFTRLSNRMSKI